MSKKAFSLIELSIVILIIGILIAGVTQGSRLVAQMRLASARAITQSSPVSSIRGLLMWYESTSQASFDEADADNTQPINTWYDINPTGTVKYNLSSSGSARPTYRADCINSLPCARFNGSSTYLVTLAADISGPELSIFIVNRRTAFSIYSSPISASPGAATADNNSIGAVYPFNEGGGGGGTISTYRNATLSVYSSHPGNNVPYIAASIFNGATNTFYYNGAAQTAVASTGNFSSTRFIVGARWESSVYNWFYNGDIAEVIVFNRGLKNEERDSIEDYLSKKWGIKVS